MATKRYRITENELKNTINKTLNEIFNRDFWNAASSLGIKDPTENDVLNQEELKEKCNEFLQRCNEFSNILNSFYGYIYGVEEDAEAGTQEVRGALDIMRSRNMFGARNLTDEYLESDLKDLSDSLRQLKSALSEAVECSETFI